MANTASQASNTHIALRRTTLVLDRPQTLSRRINVCSETWIMVTRIVPRPIAGITIDLAHIGGTTTKPPAHTRYKLKGERRRSDTGAIQFFKRHLYCGGVCPMNLSAHSMKYFMFGASVCPPSCCRHASFPSSSPVFIGGIFAVR